MIIRLGYVSTAVSLWDPSPAKTVTYKTYSSLDKEARMEKLHSVTKTNLYNTLRMLYFNAAQEIEVYRLSSSIVPLATHPDVLWDFVSPFVREWREIGDFIKQKRMRVSFHPNQFTLFTSPERRITENAVRDMEFHYRMLEAIGVEDSSYMNIHVGGAYGDKAASLARFYDNIRLLPLPMKEKMTLENDDKTYTAAETLSVCERIQVPLVFDYHHHVANPCEEPLEELLVRGFATWQNTGLPPKIHISSPKSEKAFRSHADYVDTVFLEPLLASLKQIGTDVDFMIEAKSKEQALIRLAEDLSSKRGIKRLGGAKLQL